jgi:hypothetical protein
MIKSIQYTANGTEDGIIYCNPASGYVIIDVLVNGLSVLIDSGEVSGFQASVDNTYGKVSTSGLNRGDLLQVVYKTKPSYSTDREFDPANFNSNEFA